MVVIGTVLYYNSLVEKGVPMSYKVKMNMFEGPFDLLVYLIENAEMSIYEIEVSKITKQYLDYIGKMEELDVTIATEFMVLAATLIEIKSKMLLPRISPEQGPSIEEDPRQELISRLLDYKKYKAASEMLSVREDESSRIFEKPKEDISRYTEEPEEYLKMDLEQFINAFNLFMLKKQRLAEIRRNYQRLKRDRVSIDQRILFIEKVFTARGATSLPFMELLARKDRYDAVITFASILEMIRDRSVDAIQKENFGEISITKLSEQEKEG